ncbi:MAG TPA: flagellar hook-length control protein FliK [Solirubrobacteraceae bacterium]
MSGPLVTPALSAPTETPPTSGNAPPGAPPEGSRFQSALDAESARTADAEGQQSDTSQLQSRQRTHEREATFAHHPTPRTHAGDPQAGASEQPTPANAAAGALGAATTSSNPSPSVPTQASAPAGAALDPASTDAAGGSVAQPASSLPAGAVSASPAPASSTLPVAAGEGSGGPNAGTATNAAAPTTPLPENPHTDASTNAGQPATPARANPAPATAGTKPNPQPGTSASSPTTDDASTETPSPVSPAPATASDQAQAPTTHTPPPPTAANTNSSSTAASNNTSGLATASNLTPTSGPRSGATQIDAEVQSTDGTLAGAHRSTSPARPATSAQSTPSLGAETQSATLTATGASAESTPELPEASGGEQAAPQITGGPLAQLGSSTYGVGLERAIETVHATIELAARQGLSQARIALQPEELGEIRIHLTQTSAGLTARVTAESASAAQALAAGHAELRQSLGSIGLSLTRLDVGHLEQSAASGSQQGGEGARGQATPRATSGAGRTSGADPDPENPTPELIDETQRPPAADLGGALVDVLV